MRVAIWLQGGVGGGNFSQGYPPLVNFTRKLAHRHAITVYSILPANEDFVPEGFSFRSITRKITARKFRTILLSFLFLWDHFRQRYDLIHAFWVYPAGTLAVVLGKITRVPSIVTIQGGEAAAVHEIGYGNMLKPWLKKVTIWTCENTTCLNSISGFLVSEMRRHGLRRKDVVVIPFGAEQTIFTRQKKNRADKLHIIHVSNLTEVKDQAMLLRAFSRIKAELPCELRILGADYMNGKLQSLASTLNLTEGVDFLGAIPNDQLDNHYAWADIMMHTSLHEGQSGVVMEAMATGVVVCGTKVGIIADLGDDYFETVDVGDYISLAKKVVTIAKDESKYRRLQEKAFTWVQEHDANWTVRAFDELYGNVKEGKRA
jgi:glycosyltransferase involved in cell wall biosynthesis